MGDGRIRLSDIKEHISCFLCKDYLNEATTIIECLHTFCKSCIVKYLNDNNITCPKCENVIHSSHPLQYISSDRTMQDIVSKLVPNHNNLEGATKNNGKVPITENSTSVDGSANKNKLKPIDTNCQGDYHRQDEQINLVVSPSPNCGLKTLKNKFIRISCLATVTHLKKYIALKIFGDMDRFKELDLLCNDNLQGKDHNFKFVAVTQWRDKAPPIELTYCKNEYASSY